MKPLIDHVKNFSTADVSVVTVAPDVARLVGGEIQSAGELTRLISRILHKHLNRRVVSLPASDGHVFVVDNTSSDATSRPSPQSLSEAVAEASAKLAEIAPKGIFPRVEIRFVGGVKQRTITHEEFIALKPSERHEQTLEIMRELPSSQILFLRNVPREGEEQGSVYAFEAERIAFNGLDLVNHRDKRLDTDPMNLAADIQLMRKVCEQISHMFDRGDVVPQYCPLNFNTLKDSRYWPVYEVEMLDIATYFRPFIRWEIINLPAGTPQNSVSNVVERLRAINGSVSVCQSGRAVLEKGALALAPLMTSDQAFYIPSLVTGHEEKAILGALVNYATKYASRAHSIGLRNVPASAHLPLKLFGGGVFLDPNESRRLNLITSELVEVA